jgi:GTPase
MNYDVPLRVAVGGSVDAGKCLKKDTPVLMFNGKIKMIQYIKLGEHVMGDDSHPREVINTTSGKDIMYKITMKRGGDYTVNSHHILCLKRTNIECVSVENNIKAYTCRWWENIKVNRKRIYWNDNKEEAKEKAFKYLKEVVPKLPNYTPPGTVIDINVEDYLKLPKSIQQELYGYKVGVTFKYQNVKLDPYLLGLWLGDGKRSKPSITNIDKPILDKLNQICIKNYNLDNNKHIPDEYKYNSKEVQLKVLAGMIDSDGYYSPDRGTFTITQKNKRLLEDLEFICRSLGFWTSINDKYNKRFQKMYYRMCIMGELNTVPTILPRKQENSRKTKVGYMVSKIKVIKLEEDYYFGVSLSGNNQRFLLGDFTVTHNSSLLGHLKTKILDDGNGSARQCIFNFPHEKISGRTSSVAQRSMVIDDKKIIFFDLAGHEKYFRTTLFGISCSYPDVMMVLIESNRGVLQMTKEHIISAIYLRIPIILVLTKIDIALPKKLNLNIRKIKKMMKNAGKHVYEIKEENNIDLAVKQISETFVPLFQISAVKGNYINPPLFYLTSFLNKINVNKTTIEEEVKGEVLFVIDKSFRAEGYPLIGSGYMRSGKINVYDKLFLGPINNEYVEVNIRSIHDDDRNNVSFLRKNEMGCVAIRTKENVLKNKRQLLAGMVITNVKRPFVKKFVGDVTIFSNHSTTIKVGYNTIIHCGAVKKAIKIYKITDKDNKDLECLRGGDKNIIMYFEFIQGTHFLLENDRFIFREGNTRGSGHVMKFIE